MHVGQKTAAPMGPQAAWFTGNHNGCDALFELLTVLTFNYSDLDTFVRLISAVASCMYRRKKGAIRLAASFLQKHCVAYPQVYTGEPGGALTSLVGARLDTRRKDQLVIAEGQHLRCR